MIMADVEEVQGQKEVVMERGGSVEEPDQPKTLPVQIPRVSARTITGPANLQNQGAIDWGQHGLLAYGSNYSIVVIDTKNIQTIQCLDKHKSMVNKMLWEKVQGTKNLTELTTIDLVSSDTTGHIIVWDVASGIPRAVLQEGNKPVMDMQWVNGYDGNDRTLAALHPPYSLVIWDIRNKTKIWKKTYTETLVSFKFDPFDASKMAFLCNDCILFVDDFTHIKVPSSNGRKFYVSSPRMNPSASSARGSVSNLSSVGLEEKQRSRDRLRLRRLMKDLVVGETKPKPDDFMTVSECLQLEYHQSLRHHLLLLYAREVLILDLHINQTVGIIPLEKSGSPLVQIKSVRQRDILYCLHESGSVSAKFRRRQLGFVGSPLDAPAGSISSFDMGSFTTDVFMEMGYEQRCQSEVIRHTKGSKVLGMAVNPICEKRIALFLNMGKVVFLELRLANNEMPYPLGVNGSLLPNIGNRNNNHNIPHRRDTLNEVIAPLMNDSNPPLPPLRLLVTGLLTSAASLLTVVRMCPPLTTRNWQQYTPLMAGGTASGLIQVFNMSTGAVDKELAVHSYAVRGIEWTNLTSFLSYAYPNISTSSGLVRNEFFLTETLTGSVTPLRADQGDEQPIDMVRVSPLKQYFVVILKDGPFELWDLRNLCMLRTMPKKFPSVAALEWSPIHNLKSLKKKLAYVEEKEQSEPTNIAASAPSGDLKGESVEKQLVAREHFVFSDSDSQLYHFSVEGNIVRDGIKIPPENGVGTVTSIALKNDQIVQGDVDGMLNIWDLKARTSKNIHTGRGWIKKMRFAPGKGNLKLLILYSDGVDVVDLKKNYERISQLKCPKDMVKVLDIDWAASDKPVLATQDGCLRIMDMTLTTSFSPLIDYEFQEPVFCPTLLPPKAASSLQLLLSSQFWEEQFSLTFSTKNGFSEQELQAVNEQLGMVDPELLDYIRCCPHGTAERSLIAARIFGNQSEIDFWTVALYYLQIAKLELKHGKTEVEQPSVGDLINTGSPTMLDTKRINRYPHLQPLDSCFDVLCEPYSYQRMQLERVSLHESKRGDYQHTKKVIEQLILLGEMDRAVQLLLETEFDNSSYYTDAIKACLVATIQSTGAAQSTIKLVATNLIANGNIWEGVQLLCLIGKGLDACRYLISYGLWESAVWLAKSVLPFPDMQEVMRKWSDYLWAGGHKNKAILVTLSMGQFERTLELLGMQRLHAQAGLLLQACKEFGVFLSSPASELLVNAVQLDFARLLFDLGNHPAALQLSQQLGTAGEKLIKEFNILSSEHPPP